MMQGQTVGTWHNQMGNINESYLSVIHALRLGSAQTQNVHLLSPWTMFEPVSPLAISLYSLSRMDRVVISDASSGCGGVVEAEPYVHHRRRPS